MRKVYVHYASCLYTDIHRYFQVTNYGAWKPVRHADLGHRCDGMCVGNNWLVTTSGFNPTSVYIYTLPGIQRTDYANFTVHRYSSYSYRSSDPQFSPCADNTGLVYVPLSTFVAVLKISDTGKLTAVRNLTADGQLLQTAHISIAVGPHTGQLCASFYKPPKVNVLVVNTADDTIAHTLTLPTDTRITYPLVAISGLDTGQILVLCHHLEEKDLFLYRSVAEPPVKLTDIPMQYTLSHIIGHIMQFLVLDTTRATTSKILAVAGNGRLLNTVEILNGKDGVWLVDVVSLAVWEDCAWVVNQYGSMVLLCPV